MKPCYSFALLTAPVSEPLTLAEAKAHVRQDDTADDTLITSLITAVRTYTESVFGCYFMAQTWTMYLDYFPRWEIDIPKRPLRSIDSIKYIDSGGTQQTLDASKYTVDTKSFIGKVVPSYGNFWPTVRSQINAIEIQFQCGWGAIAGTSPGTTAYTPVVTPNWNTTVGYSNLGITTFQADFSTSAPGSASVRWFVFNTTSTAFYRGTTNVVEGDLSVVVTLGVPVLTDGVVGGIPEHLRQALLMILAEWYEHREPNIIGTINSQLEMTAKLLFASDRIWPV